MSIGINEVEKLLQYLKTTQNKLYSKLEKNFPKLSKTQKINYLISKDFEQLLYQVGISEYLKRVDSVLANKIAETLKGFSKQISTERAKIVFNNAKLLRDSKILSAKGLVDSSIAQMKSTLLESVLFDLPYIKTIEKLDSIQLASHQIKAFVNTSYANISRDSTAIAFKGDTESRFQYDGGLIDTSSDICTWLIENQDPKGYTMDEIIQGIETPFGTIDWNGRIPNWNCIHFWTLILDGE